MKKKRFAADAVQYFWQIGFHPSALPRRQNYDTDFRHRRSLPELKAGL
jgi:hypothetical protein